MGIRSADVEGEAIGRHAAVGGAYTDHFLAAAEGLFLVERVALVVYLILQGVLGDVALLGFVDQPYSPYVWACT